MKQVTLLVFLLVSVFFIPTAQADDLYIANCNAHAYLNPATKKVDVDFAARVCDTNTDWWDWGTHYFTVRFYPNLTARPSFPPSDTPYHIDVSSSFDTWGSWWYYAATCEDVKYTVRNISYGMGVYNLYCVVDPDNVLGTADDASESNNIFGGVPWRIGPDLYVAYFWYSQKGAELKYKFKVCNKGTHKAENFRVGIYFNRTTPPGDGEYSDTFKSYTELDPPNCAWNWSWGGTTLECTPLCTEEDIDGDKKPDPIEVTRNPTPNGFYQSYCKADSGEFVEEANEDNNVSAPIFINMANPDLVINKFEATVSESAPYTVTYTVEVCNIGAVESGVYWIDLYYHRERDNPPTSGQPGDVHVGEPSLPHGPLPSDDEYPRPAQCVTHQFLRYNTPVGEYSSYLQADADDFVIDPDRVTNQKGPLPVEVPKGVMPAGCEDHDGDGFGYGRDCAQEPLCVINCEGNETCIAGCPVDESKLDCDDDDPAVHPGAEEDCTNNIDDNCNGTANDGCAGVNCVDNDGDGVPAGPDCNPSNVDCDDDDPDRKPGQADICGDNIDNDCDGYADDCCPGVDVCDEDGDGACTGTACPGPRDPECVAACDGNISCIEECPPMKDPACVAECEGKPNYNTCVAECPDFKDPACVALCEGKPNYTACVAACPPPQDGDDSNPDCGWAGSVEICGDHVDNDCDGIPDDGCPGTYCEDNDNDGFGVGEGCQGPQDCDDNNPDMNPGATENCGDGIDDNCDFVPDGMCDTCVDMDGDGYFAGNGEDCVGLPKDCDDTRAWVHPGGVEICGNNDDENCNLSITDTPCVDPADAEECLALPPEQIEACLEEHNTSGPPDNCLAADTTATGPCHDPACILACQEACATGVGCDTGLNACIDACPIWVETCVDTDGDGWGVGPGCPWEDCAPDDDTIFPNAVETCDGIDNDCDGTADDWSAAGGEQCLDHECVVGCSGDATCLGMCPTVDCVDHDGDGWGVGADCDRQDPDDNNPSTYPNAREICGDGIDQDGDNVADDDCPICKDHDGDGFGVGPGCAQLDCDDSNPDINPGVNEVCGETDTNCDGKTPAATICVESVGTCQCRAVGQRNSRAPLLPILLVMLLLGGLRLRRE